MKIVVYLNSIVYKLIHNSRTWFTGEEFNIRKKMDIGKGSKV